MSIRSEGLDSVSERRRIPNNLTKMRKVSAVSVLIFIEPLGNEIPSRQVTFPIVVDIHRKIIKFITSLFYFHYEINFDLLNRQIKKIIIRPIFYSFNIHPPSFTVLSEGKSVKKLYSIIFCSVLLIHKFDLTVPLFLLFLFRNFSVLFQLNQPQQ